MGQYGRIKRIIMQRFVRLNEVQYTDDERQANALMEQGFVPAPLEGEKPKEKKGGKKSVEDNG
jgi:hypothetical protein